MTFTKVYITKFGGYFGVPTQLHDGTPVFALNDEHEKQIEERLQQLTTRTQHISSFDRVTKLALASTMKAFNSHQLPNDCTVIAASARGATETLEKAINSFTKDNKVLPLTSPFTTSGGIASSVARLLSKTPDTSLSIGTSMACASFFEALLIAQSFIVSKQSKRVVVIGAEAPLTPFTIAQMKALKIYSKYQSNSTPCRPFDCIDEHKNSLVLGEASATFFIESEESLKETNNTPIAELSGIGFSQELASTVTGMTDEGIGYQTSMKHALKNAQIHRPDFIIAHAAGTVVGDSAEKTSLETLFNNEVPPIFSTKHLTGHTFGASAAISMLFAIESLQQQTLPKTPFGSFMNESYNNYLSLPHQPISSCLINASGFGGVSISTVLRRPHS